MNKWLFFIGGLLTGIVLTAVIGLVLRSIERSNPADNTPTVKERVKPELPDGVTFFKEPGEIMNAQSYQVFQVVYDNGALVREPSGHGTYYGTVCLLVSDENNYFYDDQIVKVPQGKVARQVGIYKYPTKSDIIKTVPIITIMDK